MSNPVPARGGAAAPPTPSASNNNTPAAATTSQSKDASYRLPSNVCIVMP